MSSDIKKTMWKAMSDSPKVMVSLVGEDVHAEPMYAQLDKEAGGEFWFYTSRDNRIAKGVKRWCILHLKVTMYLHVFAECLPLSQERKLLISIGLTQWKLGSRKVKKTRRF